MFVLEGREKTRRRKGIVYDTEIRTLDLFGAMYFFLRWVLTMSTGFAGLELALYTNFKLTDIFLPLPPKFWN